MIPKTKIPEEIYKAAFRQYVYGLAEKWLESGVELSHPDEVLDKIAVASQENHRASYLKYLLPLADSTYSAAVPSETVALMHKVLFSLRLNDAAYNDFMLDRFCDILLKDVDKRGLFSMPLPEDYKDLQKLLWTFVQTFRRKLAAQYPQYDGAI
ncbi:hypothetical protein L1N85_19285 [Paenibacillus alkaliterrae]|uniref:hypothetical protein n=1 Tax=Paenibacillus alkaliterrae TaxID=320909 RepID=UPI001F2D6892|nr:hypothetical protein [Paenibacillus alkaliterrae]MCF2940539.1 hypothetical protein [Paenibacillus alkaliterrae]